MRIRDTNWMQVERYLEQDDRCVVPLGSTEQHGYLSLMTDTILPERVAVEAAEPLGVPVFPALPYGVAPYFLGYPGTIALRLDTYLSVIGDILDSLHGAGFRRILLVNGHGGNRPAPPWPWNGWPPTRMPPCASTTGGRRRGRGSRCSAPTPSPRTRPGSRTSPGRGWRASRFRPARRSRSGGS